MQRLSAALSTGTVPGDGGIDATWPGFARILVRRFNRVSGEFGGFSVEGDGGARVIFGLPRLVALGLLNNTEDASSTGTGGDEGQFDVRFVQWLQSPQAVAELLEPEALGEGRASTMFSVSLGVPGRSEEFAVNAPSSLNADGGTSGRRRLEDA